MVKIVPYLNLPNAKKGIDLYQKLFDAKVLDHRPFSKDQPTGANLPADFDYANSTMYAYIEILGQQIHMSDANGSVSPLGMVDLYLELDSEEQITKIFTKAKDLGCKINVPLAKQFWGALYTNFKDPIGITWQLSAAPQQTPTSSVEKSTASQNSSSKTTGKKASTKKASTKKTSTKKTTKKGK